jgi:hypothetical protein
LFGKGVKRDMDGRCGTLRDIRGEYKLLFWMNIHRATPGRSSDTQYLRSKMEEKIGG